MHLRWLDRFLGGRYLDEISRALVDRITDARVAEGVSNATVNRTLEVARAILRKALNDWEWLDRVPRIRMLKEPTRRVRFLSREEAGRLLAALPEHLAEMARFSLATGPRRGNVTGLQWTQIDLVRRCAWIHPQGTKGHRSSLKCGSGADLAAARRETCNARVQLQRKADMSGQHQGVVRRSRAGRHHGLSLARSAAHLGELARAARHAAVRITGAWGLGKSGDGASLCAPVGGAPGTLCGSLMRYEGCG